MTDKTTGRLPASWGGVDLAAAADLPLGNFANRVRRTKDPLFGWPAIPDAIAGDLALLQRDCPPAVTRQPELIARIATRRAFNSDKYRGGSLQHDPIGVHADDILADFATRCREEEAGLRHAESDWHIYANPDDGEWCGYGDDDDWGG